MISPELYSDMRYAVIGDLLLMDDCGPLLERLREDLFAAEPWVSLYRGIRELYSGGKVDLLLLRERVGDRGLEELKRAMELTPTANNWAAHAAALHEAKRVRDLQALGLQVAGCYDTDEIGQTVGQMGDLLAPPQGTRILSAPDAAIQFWGRQTKEAAPEYLSFGLPELDRNLYAEKGDFIVIGGYPSAGKTLLSLQFAARFAQAKRVGYFTLETSPQKLTDRLMAHLSAVELPKIKRRELTDEDQRKIGRAAGEMSKLRLDFVAASGMTVYDIRTVTQSKRYELIFVDYLQLVSDPANNRYEAVTAISQGLHTLAQSNGVTVIALAQLRRPEKERGKLKPPTMADFRESGQIEQDADIALLMWTSDPDDNRSSRVLKIAKNKEGERARMELDFDGATQTFRPHQETRGEHYNRIHKEIREAGKRTAEDGQITFEEVKDEELPF